MTRATCFPAARTIIICVNGAIRPPLMPWRMRNPINEFADQARPHKAEESVKAEKHQRYSDLAPMRSTSQPLSGSIRASARRYPLVTHWIAVRLLCRSTARLESDTLTMVASSCERKESSTATVVIFQTNGSRPPDSLEDLGKGGQNLIGGANASETREDIFKGEAVMLSVLAGAGIFDEHKGKAQASTLTRGGLDACVGGDACEDDRVDAAGFELLLEVGAGEGAPMALGDEDVAGVETGGRSDLRRCGRQRLIAQVGRLVDGELHEVIEIDAHVDDGSAMCAKNFGKFFGVFDDLCRGMRHGVHADDGILEIDEDKCGLFRVELEFCHGSSLLKMF